MAILILHGIGGHAGIHWEQWLHDELKKQGCDVIMPQLSHSEHPDRKHWLAEVKQAVAGVNDELIIVGHSLGVTTALDFIESASESVKGLVSVAGFTVDYGAELNSYFLRDGHVDFPKVKRNLGKSVVFFGDDDPYVAPEALRKLADDLGVVPTVIPGGGHLNIERGFTTFPALLEAVRKIGA